MWCSSTPAQWANDRTTTSPGWPGSVQVLFGDGKLQRGHHRPAPRPAVRGLALRLSPGRRRPEPGRLRRHRRLRPSALGYRGRVWALWGSAAGISASRTTVLVTGGEGRRRQPRLRPAPGTGAGHRLKVVADAHVDLYRVRNDGRLGARRRISIGSPGIVGRNFEETGFGTSMSASGDLLVIGAPEAGAILDGGRCLRPPAAAGPAVLGDEGDAGLAGRPGRPGGVRRLRPGCVHPRRPGGDRGAIGATRPPRNGRRHPAAPGRAHRPWAANPSGQAPDPGECGGSGRHRRHPRPRRGRTRDEAVRAGLRGDLGRLPETSALLSVPFIAGTCSSGWLSADHKVDPAKPGPPPVSVLRRFVDGVAVDEPVIAVDDYTLQIGSAGQHSPRPT